VTLLNRQLTQAEYQRTVWSAAPESDTELEDMLHSPYWAHVAKSLRPGDRIEVTPQGGAWFADLLVRSNGEGGPKLAVLTHLRFGEEKQEAASADTYEAKFSGSDKWRVLRKKDKEIMTKGLATREEAEAWIEDHLTSLV
jgi:hypothetical protein